MKNFVVGVSEKLVTVWLVKRKVSISPPISSFLKHFNGLEVLLDG